MKKIIFNEIPFKNYYSVIELAYHADCGIDTARGVIKWFNITVVKSNGKQCIRRESTSYFRRAYLLYKKSGINSLYLQSMPVKIKKQMVNAEEDTYKFK